MANDEQHGNSTSALAKLLNQLNLPTIGMIVLMGGGNWLQTKAGADFNAQEIERATREIHDLYPRLQEAIERQKKIQETLDNQGRMLEQLKKQ